MLTDIIRNAHLMKTKESRQYNINTLCHNCMPDLFQTSVVLAGKHSNCSRIYVKVENQSENFAN